MALARMTGMELDRACNGARRVDVPRAKVCFQGSDDCAQKLRCFPWTAQRISPHFVMAACVQRRR